MSPVTDQQAQSKPHPGVIFLIQNGQHFEPPGRVYIQDFQAFGNNERRMLEYN